jgi:plastocyanin
LTKFRLVGKAELVRRLLLLALAAVALGAGRGDGPAIPRLVGTVGPGFTIDLADANGTHINSVVAGRYEVLVHDLSDEHNFVLGNKATGERPVQTEVAFVGDRSFSVELEPGLYVYACSPHFETMNGRLTVVPRAPVVQTQTLSASVDARRASLSRTRATPGRYRVTVIDRSRSRNFHLSGPGVDRRTGKTFTGTVTWIVQLRAGAYRFGSDPRLLGRLIVAS